MKYVITKKTAKERKFLNPPTTRLDADIVFDLENAHLFSSTDEARDFIYTTTFFDKGYIAVPVKESNGKRTMLDLEDCF